ncbi:MAG TPA: YfiR family protein [candidate division Zixibacteria bacterium]|nr:YfiR family protein [candidate division Zixibacteria bacterium]
MIKSRIFSSAVFIFFVLFFVLASPTSHADDAVTNMASMITKLASFVGWPESRASEGDGNLFVISVVGDSPLLQKLKEYNKQEITPGVMIKVRKVPSDMIPSNSHVLVIGNTDALSLKKMVARVAGTSTVTVSSGYNLGGKGAIMNIYEEPVTSKVVVEIDAAAARSEHIEIKPQFLKIARILNAED